jgi:polyphosphate kinase
LYDASNAGVEIDLLVRGVCALKPGVLGVSENIRVRSVVGRYLEHTRIFYFLNEGEENVYLSSADWMYRNLFKRIEVCFPILDAKVKKRVIQEGLDVYLKDNMNAWEMMPDSTYQLAHKRGIQNSAQQALMQLYGQDLPAPEISKN